MRDFPFPWLPESINDYFQSEESPWPLLVTSHNFSSSSFHQTRQGRLRVVFFFCPNFWSKLLIWYTWYIYILYIIKLYQENLISIKLIVQEIQRESTSIPSQPCWCQSLPAHETCRRRWDSHPCWCPTRGRPLALVPWVKGTPSSSKWGEYK